MLSTLVQMAVMAIMIGGVVVVGIAVLGNGNGGNNLIVKAVRDFSAGVQAGTGSQLTPSGNSHPQEVEVMPVHRLKTVQSTGASLPQIGQRPGKVMAVLLVLFAVGYLISPVDLICDVVPIVCHADDAALMAWAVKNAFKAFFT